MVKVILRRTGGPGSLESVSDRLLDCTVWVY